MEHMFIKLTRKYNGGYVWINADRVVAVETGGGGGSVVVPDGEDIDYDVIEDPETVMELLEVEIRFPDVRAKAINKKLENSGSRRRIENVRGRRFINSKNRTSGRKDGSDNAAIHV